MAIAARRTTANHLAIHQHGLIAEGIGIIGVDLDGAEAVGNAGLLLANQGVSARKRRLVQADEAIEAGLEGGVLGVQIRAPHAVALFKAHAVHRPDADMAEAVGGPRRHNFVEKVVLIFDRMMQFPAERADKVDAKGAYPGAVADRDFLRRQPGEGFIGNVGIGKRLQDFSCIRPGKDKHTILRGHISEMHRAVPRHEFLQEILIIIMGATARDQKKALAEQAIFELGDGEFRAHRTRGVERMGKRDAARFLWDVVGDESIQEGPCSGAFDLEF